jgi:hypothetical protein
MDFFLQSISQLWNVNKMNNAIRLQNVNWEAEWNTKQRWDAIIKKKKDTENKARKDLADREKTVAECWEAHKKISYKGEVDGHGIDTIICLTEMAELNPNDINYFKGQTITDLNTGNKISLHDAVVDNVDGVIYLVEKEGVNIQEYTTFNKNYGNLAVKDKGAAEAEKFLPQYYTENGMKIPEINQQRVMENTYIPWDNSKTKH